MTPRRTREELRSLLLRTGYSMLADEGLGSATEHLTFKRVFDRVHAETGARITNSSVIGRIWESTADYQADVLALVAADDGHDEYTGAIDAVLRCYQEADVSTLESRRHGLQRFCLVACEATFESLTASRRFLLWFGVWGLAASGVGPVRDARVDRAIRLGYASLTGRVEQMLRVMLVHYGFRMRSPYTVHHLAVSISAFAQGCALVDRVDPASTREISRPTGPMRSDEQWTLYGVGVEALLAQFVEPDPGWTAAPWSVGEGFRAPVRTPTATEPAGVRIPTGAG